MPNFFGRLSTATFILFTGVLAPSVNASVLQQASIKHQVSDLAGNDATYRSVPVVQAVALPDNSIPEGVLRASEQKKTEQLLKKYPPFLKSWDFQWGGQRQLTVHYFLMDARGAMSISCYPQDQVFAPENDLIRQGVAQEIKTKVLPAVQAQINTTQPALLNAWDWVSADTRTEDVASLQIKRHKFKYVYVLVPTPPESGLENHEKPKNFQEVLEQQRQQERLQDWRGRYQVQQKFWENLGFLKGQSHCDPEACVSAFWYPSVSKMHDL